MLIYVGPNTERKMRRVMRKPKMWFSNRPDTDRPVHRNGQRQVILVLESRGIVLSV